MARRKNLSAKNRSTRQHVALAGDNEEVINRQRKVRVELTPLRKFLRRIKTDLGLADSQVTVCLVTDPEIARMNKSFRKMRGPTDVLSFPSRANRKPARFRTGKIEIPGGTVLGDIAISPETARRYAKKDGRAPRVALQILILHGVLHLLGYDHEADHGEMSRLETQLRKHYGLPQ